MANKAVNQMPSIGALADGDLLYVVRSGTDYNVDASSFAGRIQSFGTIIDSGDVLQLGTTPFVVVPAPAATQVLMPLMVYFQYVGGTTDYTSTGNLAVYHPSLTTKFGEAIGMGASGDGNTMFMFGGQVEPGTELVITTDDSADPTTGDRDLRVVVFYTTTDAS
jgi:hypothetical protein